MGIRHCGNARRCVVLPHAHRYTAVCLTTFQWQRCLTIQLYMENVKIRKQWNCYSWSHDRVPATPGSSYYGPFLIHFKTQRSKNNYSSLIKYLTTCNDIRIFIYTYAYGILQSHDQMHSEPMLKISSYQYHIPGPSCFSWTVQNETTHLILPNFLRSNV